MNTLMNHPIVAGIGPFGTTEMIVVAVLVLVLFGAKKLPTFARAMGKSLGEFKKGRDEFHRELTIAQEEVVSPSTGSSR